MPDHQTESDKRVAREHSEPATDTGSLAKDGGRQQAARPTWERVQAVLRLERGISAEIACDPGATVQGIVVLALSSAISSILFPPIIILTLPVLCASTALAAGLSCLISRAFSDDVPAFPQWFRVFLFTSAPAALGVVPFIGGIAGGVYTTVLQVVAVRDLARVGTGTAVLMWLLAVALPWIVLLTLAFAIGLAAFL